ncbi:MAG: DUF3598 family protein [Candidatus Melainabacteria bacterium]|nr:DUF3598 family protein [Candidatus Melainabacteria bacterium]
MFNKILLPSLRSLRELFSSYVGKWNQFVLSYLPQFQKPKNVPSDINWNNFVDQHVYCWNGVWTRYYPDGRLIERFISERKFSFAKLHDYYVPIMMSPLPQPVIFYEQEDYSTVNQKNTYTRTNSISEQSWQLIRQENSLRDGVYHPQADSQRGLFLENGLATWSCTDISLVLATETETTGLYAIEIFLRHENLRVSVGLVFDTAGEVQRLAIVRESVLGSHRLYWTQDSTLPSSVDLPQGQYSAEEYSVSSGLEYSRSYSIFYPSSWAEQDSHRVVAFPDGVLVRFPLQMQSAVERVIEVIWMIKSAEPLIYRAKLVYNASGQVDCFSGGLFKKDYKSILA